jgi:hypothetical protein
MSSYDKAKIYPFWLGIVVPKDTAVKGESMPDKYVTSTIVGYLDKTFRGNRAMTRYEFAAGFETSFIGQDLLINRLELSNFGSIRNASGNASMTRLNFDTNTNNDVILPHILYSFPVSSAVTFTAALAGVGYTGTTDTLTPPTVGYPRNSFSIWRI